MRRTVRRSGVAVLTGAIVLSCEYRAAASAPPPDQSTPSVSDAAAEVLPIRTFEFLAHRVSVLSTDDAALLFEWTPDQYFAELRAQKARGEGGPPPRVEWVGRHDGLIWGRSDTEFVAQWGGDRAFNQENWTYFQNPERHKADFEFPASTRVMGMTDDFVWHGWPNNALEFYAPEHKGEFPHIWINLAVAQQMFLACVDPDGAFLKYSCPWLGGEKSERRVVLPDGRTRREVTYTPTSGKGGSILHVVETGDDPATEPATWRFVIKSSRASKSHLFIAEWRETTSTSQRFLPALPKETPSVHADVERINDVGVRDHTGLGLWDDGQVEYLKVTPGIAAYNWFASPSVRWLTNIAVFVAPLSLFWRERATQP